jgi:hypothetical protein
MATSVSFIMSELFNISKTSSSLGLLGLYLFFKKLVSPNLVSLSISFASKLAIPALRVPNLRAFSELNENHIVA